jgi:hypothetical protein
MDAASTMRMVMVVWDRLDAPIWELLALADEEAGTWLVSVTESTEADAPLLVGAAFLIAEGVVDVEEVEEVEVDEVVVVETVELVELAELRLGVDEVDSAYSADKFTWASPSKWKKKKRLTEEVDNDAASDAVSWSGEGVAEAACWLSEWEGEAGVFEGVEGVVVSSGGLAPAPTAPGFRSAREPLPGRAAARTLIMRLILGWSRRWGESGEMALAAEGLARAKRRARAKRNVMASLPLRRKDMARRLSLNVDWFGGPAKGRERRERDGGREEKKAENVSKERRGGNGLTDWQ